MADLHSDVVVLYLKKIFFMTIFLFLLTGSYLWHLASSVFTAACRILGGSMQTLSCSMWDLVPWLGIPPRPPALGMQSLSHWTTREVLWFFIFTSVVIQSVQSISRVQLDPMNHSTPGLPVHHQLPEFTQTRVHQVGDAIQPSHPLLSPSPFFHFFLKFLFVF